MTAAADALRNFVAPLLPGWRIQFGRWVEGASKTDRFAVIKPAGGLPAELVRRPQFTLSLIGGMSVDDELSTVAAKADEIVEAMRASAGSLVYLEASEPVFMATGDGRPVFDIAVSAITT